MNPMLIEARARISRRVVGKRPIVRWLCCSVWCGALISGGLIGCSGSDATGTPSILTTNPYTSLQLNVRGAVMSTVAPYDTLQLVPTAYAADGSAIPLPGPVTYTTSDTTVRVNTAGLVTLKAKTGTNSYVIARVQDTVQNITHADTAFILGTTTVPASPLASFSIQPVGSDTAILDVGSAAKTLTVTAKDATGKAITASSLELHYRLSDVNEATINAKTGALTAVLPGTVWIIASTTYYGVTKTDSVRYTIGYPDVTVVTNLVSQKLDGTYQGYFQRANIIVGVNKTVIFEIPYIVANAFLWDMSQFVGPGPVVNAGMSVVFDNASAADTARLSAATLAGRYAANGSGDVNLTIPSSLFAKDSVPPDTTTTHIYPLLTTYCQSAPYPCAAARSFSMAGTYTYHSALTNATGTITVVGQ